MITSHGLFDEQSTLCVAIVDRATFVRETTAFKQYYTERAPEVRAESSARRAWRRFQRWSTFFLRVAMSARSFSSVPERVLS